MATIGVVVSWLMVAGIAAPRAALAFAAEDLINGPFHHEGITERAAQARMFAGAYDVKTSGNPPSTQALDTLGWNADYIDSYLYSPLWWADALPSIDRLKVSMSTGPELKKLHFDDLTSSDRVHYMWRRYASGAMAGLLWAKEKNDVPMAQCIVGVSLHAMQDFYAHSNWVDDPARRDHTYFEIPRAQRPGLSLYTGTYELPDQLGVKHHGKLVPECSILNQPGVKQVMSAACSGFSPLSNMGLCEVFDACQKGTTVQHKVAGVTVPPNTLYLAPAGIALDNSWCADIAVKERGLTDITGKDAFATALTLAQRQSEQWLQTLEEQMGRAGAGAFWQRVKTESATQAQRTQQFENYAKFPYQFLSAGPYPPTPTTADEYYLRVRLKTGRDFGAGTNADILLGAPGLPGGNPVLLDYLPGANPIIAYDDFEAGDDGVYVVGPFSSVPNGITLRNDAPDAGGVLKALGASVVNGLSTAANKFVGVAKAVLGTDADLIGTTKKVWMPDELSRVPTAAEAPAKTTTVQVLASQITITTPAGQKFTLDVDGGDEGFYKVHGYIVKTGESQIDGPQGWREFEVRLHSLECVRESKWDRGSNSDEPFITCVLTPLPGANQKFRTEPFDDVDTGESRDINYVFQKVRVPKDYGMLNLPVAVYESDDERSSTRDELLNKFAGEIETVSVSANDSFTTALSASVGADWQLEEMEITAWSRNGKIRVGNVFNAPVNRWIKGGHTESFNLDYKGVREYVVTTDDLLPEILTTPIQAPADKPLTKIPPEAIKPPPTAPITPVDKTREIPPDAVKLPPSKPPVNKTPANRPPRVRPATDPPPTFTPTAPDGGPARTANGLKLDKGIYMPGEPIVLNFQVRAGLDEGAWIGLLPSNIEHGGEELNAAHAAETQQLQGRTVGKMEWTAPTTLGTYDFRLNERGKEIGSLSFEVKALTKEFTPTLTLPKTVFAPNEPIALDFKAFPFYAAEAWVGLIPSEIEHGREELNAMHAAATQQLEGRTQGALPFNAPTKSGVYDFRLNDSHGNEIATLSFTVTPTTPETTPTLKLNKQAFKPGEQIVVSFTAFPFYAAEAWIGLLPAEIEHGREELNAMHAVETQQLEGKTKGQLKFTAPEAAGTYDLRLNDSYGNEIAVTPPFTVAP